jgi:hypothetical protein
MRVLALLFFPLFALLASPVFACRSMENAAAKDPMRCERDPQCAKTRGKNRDCTTQCNDDPACMDRCREMTTDTGAGHR